MLFSGSGESSVGSKLLLRMASHVTSIAAWLTTASFPVPEFLASWTTASKRSSAVWASSPPGTLAPRSPDSQPTKADKRAWHAGASFYAGRSARNDDSIGIELEGLEGDQFCDAQYTALAQLCQALAAHYPIQDIAGHEDIAPGRKHDPGTGFDWPRLQRLLAWPHRMFPPRVFPAPSS